MKFISKVLTGCVITATVNLAVAAEDKTKDAALAAAQAKISASLEAGKPGLKISNVEKTNVAGMYKASIAGGPHVYVTADGKYFFTGDLYEVSPGRIVNLTDEALNGDRAKAMASIDKKDTIIFAPKGDVKKVMYVFTDVDCGYCQKLHSKVPEYNAMGVEVRYLAYPRAGINSDSYRKIASAWCADDRQAAMTKLKTRQEIPDNVCPNNPVAKQFEMGGVLGVTGTPALVLETGELIAGYVEPAQLKEMLGL